MTAYLDTVDTGVKYFALASFEDGVLVRAQLVNAVHPLEREDLEPGDTWQLVIECATVRKQDGHAKKREVDALNRSAGRIGGLHPEPVYKLPEEWKGNLPKKIDHERTVKTLTDAELEVLRGMKAAQLKHVLDSVGIGLRILGRR